MDKIIIYTQSACGYCKTVKDELTKNNIEFEVRLTNEFENEWNKIVSLTSLPTTPTIYYKGDYLVSGRDYGNASGLVNILKNYNKSDFQTPLQVLERVKTMNYNMATAFRRLDQLLIKIEEKIDKL
tara:strand:- start:207 stop:584 length:378 start_codon:yes stop_codon:yes gene_type:complete